MNRFATHRRGFGLVEIVVGTTIISLSLAGMLAAFNLFVRASLANTPRIQATFLAEEGLEAARFLRDAGWLNVSALAVGTPYYPSFSGSAWTFSATPTTTLGFTRTVTFGTAYRRTSDHDLVDASSGDPKAADADARLVTVSVLGAGASASLSGYLTNVFK